MRINILGPIIPQQQLTQPAYEMLTMFHCVALEVLIGHFENMYQGFLADSIPQSLCLGVKKEKQPVMIIAKHDS